MKLCLFISILVLFFTPSANAILLLKADTGSITVYTENSTVQTKPKAEFMENKNQTTAFILAIILGWLGIHDFYCEKMTACAIKFALGLIGLFLFFWLGPIALILLIGMLVWGIYDAVRIKNGSYLPEKGNWDVPMN